MSTIINKNQDFSQNKNFFTYDNQYYFNKNHKTVIDRINNFLEINQIPNIIFNGDNGVGKKYILNYFINKIYKFDKENIKNNTLIINCCHGKGNIKFIREDLKLFSNSTIINSDIINFKSVILVNADYLTIDAQSALRRLIELYNKTTRFFIIVNNYERLIKPIISRFCSIYIINPISGTRLTNFYKLIKNESQKYHKINYLKKYIKSKKVDNLQSLIEISNSLYNKGYSSIDIIKYIESNDKDGVKDNVTYHNDDNDDDNNNHDDDDKTNELDEINNGTKNLNLYLSKYRLLTIFENINKEFRNEKLIMFFLLNYIYFRFNYDLKI